MSRAEWWARGVLVDVVFAVAAVLIRAPITVRDAAPDSRAA
jgi:hypothetical protein